MSRRFIIETVLIAIYGQLLMPSRPVEYILPYTTLLELYDMKASTESIMPDPSDERHVREQIGQLIAFFENPFNRKKIEKALMVPWRSSSPLPVNESVSFTVVNATDNAQYGESMDPVETELILTALKEDAPILTDQFEFQEKVIQAEIPVQIFDIDDFEFAVETDVLEEELY